MAEFDPMAVTVQIPWIDVKTAELDALIEENRKIFLPKFDEVVAVANQAVDEAIKDPEEQEREEKISDAWRAERLKIAGLLGPLDKIDEGVIFQIFDRTGCAASNSHRFKEEARRVSQKGGLDFDHLETAASPMLREPFLGTDQSDVARRDSNDPYRLLLVELSDRAQSSANHPFLSWSIDCKEPLDDPTFLVAGFVLNRREKAANPFDRFRDCIIVAATLARIEVPSAFSYVAAAIDQLAYIKNPTDLARAYLILGTAMDYAHSVSVYNQMQIMGNGETPTINLRPLPERV